MKQHIYPLLLLLTLAGKAQENTNAGTNQTSNLIDNSIAENSTATSSPETKAKRRKLNFFIISKPKKFWDPATHFNIIRAKIKSSLRPTRFVCIVASSSEQMASKIKFRLNKYNAQIGNIWFDSHGSFKKGYSFFTIGKDEFSYKNINDSNHTRTFRELAIHCDSNTRIGIGSCYGGATYNRPKSAIYNESRMNGDSLIIGLAKAFNGTIVYGCESWVMTKPGLFKETFAMAGSPVMRRYNDAVYKPVWEQLGVWNSYSTRYSNIQQVNCIKLDKDGNIGTRFNHYQSKQKVKKQIAHKLSKLQEGILRS